LTTLKWASIALILTQVSLVFVPVCAGQLRLVEGGTLSYRYARVGSSWQPAYESLNASIEILTLNETTLTFRSNTTAITSTSTVTSIEYSNGIPDYADYLTALIFLPSECMAQSLQGRLNWTKQVRTRTLATVTDWTLQNLNFTVEAGSFQSINITLTLVGMDAGALTLIYDVASGIMIYEQWIPIVGGQIYGDIIILSLTAITSRPETPQTIVSLILGTAIFATPAIMFLHETRRKLQRRQHARKLEPSSIRVKDSFPRKPFYVIVGGGVLSLASILLPWSQLAGSQVHLPLSISSALVDSTPFSASTSTFLATSLIVHASAIMAWVSIAMHIYSSSRFAPQVITVGSSALAFASAIIFTQTGWTVSWGVPVVVLAGAFALFGINSRSVGKKSKMGSETS
jgi:hypothetical protein